MREIQEIRAELEDFQDDTVFFHGVVVLPEKSFYDLIAAFNLTLDSFERLLESLDAGSIEKDEPETNVSHLPQGL
jgi:hypothetical protein